MGKRRGKLARPRPGASRDVVLNDAADESGLRGIGPSSCSGAEPAACSSVRWSLHAGPDSAVSGRGVLMAAGIPSTVSANRRLDRGSRALLAASKPWCSRARWTVAPHRRAPSGSSRLPLLVGVLAALSCVPLGSGRVQDANVRRCGASRAFLHRRAGTRLQLLFVTSRLAGRGLLWLSIGAGLAPLCGGVQ
jgi:hypothetical protein